MTAEQERLVESLGGTSLNLKTFLSLNHDQVQSKEYPSYYSHRYLHELKLGRGGLGEHEALNRKNLEAYLKNIQTMEELTRVQTNLRLLKMHQAQNVAAGKRTIDVELVGLKIGEFEMVTFPGELTVEIGLNLKKASGAEAHLRGGVYERLHLLRPDGGPAAKPRSRSGRLRHTAGPRVASDL